MNQGWYKPNRPLLSFGIGIKKTSVLSTGCDYRRQTKVVQQVIPGNTQIQHVLKGSFIEVSRIFPPAQLKLQLVISIQVFC